MTLGTKGPHIGGRQAEAYNEFRALFENSRRILGS